MGPAYLKETVAYKALKDVPIISLLFIFKIKAEVLNSGIQGYGMCHYLLYYSLPPSTLFSQTFLFHF